ncbi:DNA-binding protein [Asanoa ishikariensis]|uniref:Helix-turn-helix domain-containing protein n=1 Tax=Asanoa ishikariensis TaxID=137265 RepID=A0A1H3MVT4_9ACTN|nr:helix-turn-helix transcriptional regulator [Asanoa ishikariensis]GIF66376.1 DNA-binding protein [Asanoa ishikariensis]SDY80801.1 Helix-turn-helix domain-containing protein [Asanoa ishikariensis]
MDRTGLAEFLRTRRAAVQPEDVGLPRGRRRRTGGLRREEIAALSGMSTDYYSRIEQRRGPHPSRQVLGAIAGGLRLSGEERDHLFQLGGYPSPARPATDDQVNPGMLEVFAGLAGGAAQVVSELGETLTQTPLAAALFGDQTEHKGLSRSLHYRWFTDPAARKLYPAATHARHGRLLAADLRRTYTRSGPDSRVGAVVRALLARSPEFADIWREHPIAVANCGTKRIEHPALGPLDLHCQILLDPDHSQALQVFTPVPGTGTAEKLQLLAA